MRELQRRQRIKKWIYSLPVLGILLVLAVVLGQGAVGIFKKQMESADYVRDLEARAESLDYRTKELEANIGLLDTEEGVIKEIREKFSVSEEGEYVVVIVDEPVRPMAVEEDEGGSRRGWWNFIKSLWSN
jgi:cell division protein FtsB